MNERLKVKYIKMLAFHLQFIVTIELYTWFSPKTMQIGSTTIAETFEIEICLSECRSGFLRKLNNHDEGFVASYWAAKTLQIKQIELGMRETLHRYFNTCGSARFKVALNLLLMFCYYLDKVLVVWRLMVLGTYIKPQPAFMAFKIKLSAEA